MHGGGRVLFFRPPHMLGMQGKSRGITSNAAETCQSGFTKSLRRDLLGAQRMAVARLQRAMLLIAMKGLSVTAWSL
jgi:hypothetical protein